MARILVVDDDVQLRLVVVQLLGTAGHVAAGIDDGRLAVNEVLRDPPDILLTDLAMPLFDGLQVIAALRNQAVRVPIIAMSAGFFGSGLDLTAALRAGANATLTKPFRRDELLATVDAVLARRASDPGVARSASGLSRAS